MGREEEGSARTAPKSRPDLSDTLGGWRQTERCQRVKNTWYGPPIGWIEASEAMVVSNLTLTEPQTQTPGQRGPSDVVYVGAGGRNFGLYRQDKGGKRNWSSTRIPW